MKNLKKLNRKNLRAITGGLTECNVDLDCGPTGCAICTDFRGGRRVCLYFYDPTNMDSCPDINP
ncbi:bacteriocin-like protein [Chryseobacterium sp. SIMBA_038]|uniref:bacteriocin-like protein n=1 Tax=Chryseobacterium sp. SIMBA_038 TaxID=3085780 RepID=UPI003054A9DB